MHGQGFFLQAFVYLAAAVISVPIAKRAGLGSVLGYLLAGVAIGPFVLGLVGEEGQDVMHFAEFGVVMMLFLVGLELRPSRLWSMRKQLVGMGGLQVVLTAAVMAGIALAVGQPWRVAVAIGLILSLSSTAIVLQTLQEKGLLRTDGGKSAFSVLLTQDIAVIPMLAVLPLLAVAAHAPDHGAHPTTWVEGLPGWGQTLVVLAAVAAIVLGGRTLTRPLFRWIARTRLQEIFTAAALLLVIGIALLMTWAGLSPALGTFLAGVVLGDSEYRHELEGDVEPFKGLLLGLFFIAVGASIDFGLIVDSPATIAGLVMGLIAVKFLILLAIGRIFRMGWDNNALFAFSLAQGGEFAFVLFSFATQAGVMTPAVAGPLVAAVALSMAATPLLMLLNERLIQPRFGTTETPRKADLIDEENRVIIAGHGRFGQIVGRLLRAKGVRTTVLEYDSDQVEMLRRFGYKVFYGDASRPELLRAAGAETADLLVLAIDDPEKIRELVETVRKHFPRMTLLARAKGRRDAYRLIDAGVDHVYRETLDSSLAMGVDALRLLGFPGHLAYRSGRTFRRHDEEALRELASSRHDQKELIRESRERMALLEETLRGELEERPLHEDAAWDPESLREEIRAHMA
ncbi:MAG: cation:proton antiporter [Deltaproteobacteria bacterium]|nr:cation:proton antiporter [Deltaproteobacteria bacterium]MBW2256470.1 cation:proton antiporter [Deltaproteobacteria bacterium]